MKALRRGLATALVLLMLLPVLSLPVLADDDMDVTFYDMASTASAYLSNKIAKGGSDEIVMSDVSSGMAGGFVGYCDEAKDPDGIFSWLSGSETNSSATFSYDTLSKVTTHGGDDGGSVSDGGFYAYVKYGSFLSSIGFDDCESAGNNLIRKVAGGLMLLMYNIGQFVPSMFSAVIAFMQWLNPFRWFDFHMDINGLDSVATGGVGSAMASLANVFSRLYWAVSNNIAMIILVFSTLILAVNLLFANMGRVNAQANWQKIRKHLIRAVAMFLGVPLCASLYTTTLSYLNLQLSSENSAHTRILMSTFIDFEEWARQFQLAVPNKYEGDSGYADYGAIFVYADRTQNRVSANTYSNLRRICYNINAASWKKANLISSASNVCPPDTQAVFGNGSMASNVLSDNDTVRTKDAADASVRSAAQSLLSRYADGSFYYPSTWEVDAKSRITGSDDVFEVMRDSSGRISKFEDAIVGNDEFKSGDLVFWGRHGVLSNVESGDSGSSMGFSSAGGLSDMAMYNYLTSEFNANSVTVYSSEKASSGYQKKAHYAVNLIGGGVLSALLYVNALVLMFVINFLGFFYGMAILFSNFRRLFLLIPSIFGTVAGSIKMFAKLLTYVVVMVLEILGTVVAYLLATELLMAMNDLVSTPLMYLLSLFSGDVIHSMPGGLNQAIEGAVDTGITYLGGTFLSVVSGDAVLSFTIILNIVLLILFFIVSLKARRDIVKTIEEAASAFIDKVLGVSHQDLNAGGPGLGSRAMGALGAAGGAALAQRALSGGDKSESGNTKGSSSTEKDDTKPPDGKDDGKAGEESHDAKAGEEAGGGGGSGGSGSSGTDSADASLDADGERSDVDDVSAEAKEQIENAESLDAVGNENADRDGEPDGGAETAAAAAGAAAGEADDGEPDGGESPAEAEADGGEDGGESAEDEAEKPVDAAEDAGESDGGERAAEADSDGGENSRKDAKAGDEAEKSAEAAGSGKDKKPESGKKPDDAGKSGKAGEGQKDVKTAQPGDPAKAGFDGKKPEDGTKSDSEGKNADAAKSEAGKTGDGAGKDGKPGDGPNAGTKGAKPGDAADGPMRKKFDPSSPEAMAAAKAADGAPGSDGAQGSTKDVVAGDAADGSGAAGDGGDVSGPDVGSGGSDGQGRPTVRFEDSVEEETIEDGQASEGAGGSGGESGAKPAAAAESQSAGAEGGPDGSSGPSGGDIADGGSTGPESGSGQAGSGASGASGGSGQGGTGKTGAQAGGEGSPSGQPKPVGDVAAAGIAGGFDELRPDEPAALDITPDGTMSGSPDGSPDGSDGGASGEPGAPGTSEGADRPAGAGEPAAGSGPAENAEKGASGQEAGPKAPGADGSSGKSGTRPAKQGAPAGVPAGVAVPVTGSIDGHAAEGTAVRNADGSTTVSMHRTDPGPSLSVPMSKSGIVSHSLESGPGKGGPEAPAQGARPTGIHKAGAAIAGAVQAAKDMDAAVRGGMQYGIDRTAEATVQAAHTAKAAAKVVAEKAAPVVKPVTKVVGAVGKAAGKVTVQPVVNAVEQTADLAATGASKVLGAVDKMSPAQKKAMMAAAGTFMATSNNKAISSMGTGLSQGVAMDLAHGAGSGTGTPVEPGSGQTEPDAKPEEREGEGAEFVVVRRRRRRKIHDTAPKDLPHGSAPENLDDVGK